MRKRWDIGLLRALSPGFMMMMMKVRKSSRVKVGTNSRVKVRMSSRVKVGKSFRGG